MEKTFKEESTETVLLVNAENAFISINRKAFLHISILCPAISTFVTRLFLTSGSEMISNEETTQGDSVAVAIYALGITPSIMMMVELVSTKREEKKIVAFADEFSAAGKLKSLLQWWTTLIEVGPKFGYFPEPAKSWLETKLETHAIGNKVFKDKTAKITNSTKRFLELVIGTFTFKKQYIGETVSQWISEIEVLSQISKVERQAAYCCFTTGFKHKVTYLMRITPNINEELRRLDEAINNKLIPSFTENKFCRNDERLLLSLPTKLGGNGYTCFFRNGKH